MFQLRLVQIDGSQRQVALSNPRQNNHRELQNNVKDKDEQHNYGQIITITWFRYIFKTFTGIFLPFS